jgi:hypothetical protein
MGKVKWGRNASEMLLISVRTAIMIRMILIPPLVDPGTAADNHKA